MSKSEEFAGQKVRINFKCPKTDIEELWKEGYFITRIAYGNSLWVVVGTRFV
jgi:hypothetical protein